jgi:hypothetical protein
MADFVLVFRPQNAVIIEREKRHDAGQGYRFDRQPEQFSTVNIERRLY